MASTLLNPFIVGGALSDPAGRGFFGREEIFEFVNSSLMVTRRVPIVLQGQRRIGKSSILKQLPKQLSQDFACVYYDLQGKAAMQLDQVLYGLGRAIADRLKIDRPDRPDAGEETFPLFLDQAIRHLDGRAERLILLFDEFDVVDQTFTGPEVAASRFISYLSRLVDSHSGVGYILVVGRKIEEMSESFLGSILKDSVSKPIGRLTELQTARLATEPSSGQLHFDSPSLHRIYQLTAGHPFCTQVLCHTIWNRALSGSARTSPAPVTERMVDEALPEALDLGSNGLNWIYDGLSKTAHRLILSALAEAADPIHGATASLDLVDTTLRKHRVVVDPTDLGSAPRELRKWDVLIGSTSNLVFAVPMIGGWIRENRPLEELQEHTAMANPRAQRYYELALESLRQDNYDAAIEDFRNALDANPGFIEALRGLSTSLRLRKKPGDLNLAVEAYERVLDIEPDEPRTALVELLAEEIDQGGDVSTMVTRYRRLKEMDPDGPFLQRAARVLSASAEAHQSYGSDESLAIARTLHKELGHLKEEIQTEREQRRRRLYRFAFGAIAAASFVASLNPWSVLNVTTMYSALVGGLAALSGALLVQVIDSTDDTGMKLRLRHLPEILAITFLGGGIAYYLQAKGGGSMFYYALGGFFAEAMVAAYRDRPKLKDRVTMKAATYDDPRRKLLEKLFDARQPEKKQGE